MPRMKRVSRREIIKRLRKLGFSGPYTGGDHQYMRRKDGLRIRVPNPHKSDPSIGLLLLILKHAGISKSEWEKAGR